MSSPSMITSPRLIPDAEGDALVLGDLDIAIDHSALDFDRTAHRVDDAREFREHAVAGGLDDAATVLADLRIDQLSAMRFQAFERAFLVRSHQPRVTRDIGGEDRGETPLDGLFHSLPQPR